MKTKLFILFFLSANLLAFSAKAGGFKNLYPGPSGFGFTYSISQTPDSGFMLLGDYPGYLYRLDKYGNTTKQYNLTNTGAYTNWYFYDYGGAITPDSGYACIGQAIDPNNESRLALNKMDKNGNMKWTHVYGGTEMYTEPGGGHITKDGGFIMTEYLQNNSSRYVKGYVVRADKNGDTLWTKTYADTANFVEPNGIIQTSDGGFLFCGMAYDTVATTAICCMVKLDSTGHQLWLKKYATRYSYALNVIETPDGYVFAGAIAPTNYRQYTYVVKTDKNGDSIWSYSYGNFYSQGVNLMPDKDGNYVIGGETDYDSMTYIMKVSTGGSQIWENTLYRGGLLFMIKTVDGDYAVSGWDGNNAKACQGILLKIDSNGNSSGIMPASPVKNIEASLSPNPFHSQAVVSVSGQPLSGAEMTITDALGNQIKTISGISGSSVSIDGAGLKPGIYFYKISEQGGIITGKFILE